MLRTVKDAFGAGSAGRLRRSLTALSRGAVRIAGSEGLQAALVGSTKGLLARRRDDEAS